MSSRNPARALLDQLRGDRVAISQLLNAERNHPLLVLDLSIKQLRILLLVASGEAITASDVAARLGVKQPTVSGAIDQLVDHGLVERSASLPDRRSKRLSPTDRGRELHDQLLGVSSAADEFVSELDHADLAALAQGTKAIREAIERRAQRET